MTSPTLDAYHRRIAAVLEYIDAHLDEALELDRLAGVAAFSKYHFHRQFTATIGMTVARYVQLARMQRASYRLAFRHDASVTEIASDSGYEAADAFARAFRRRVGQAPSAFRMAPEWERWSALFEPLQQARRTLMNFSLDDVVIREVDEVPVAVMTHRGDPALLGRTIQRFIAWRKANGLSPRLSATYNVFHSDPHHTPMDEYRLDLCVATKRMFPSEPDVRSDALPRGRCAVLRVIGSADDLEPAASFLYREWLPASGEEAADFPIYCQRVSFFPDVPAHEAITDLFLPLR